MLIDSSRFNLLLPPQDDHDVAAGSAPRMDAMAALAKVSSMLGTPLIEKDSAAPSSVNDNDQLQPHPFYYYRDHSTDADPDPLYPLVPPGRVPNFPAKMHAILGRPDLQHIVAWMPHGRSWRVIKPRDFELHVIPQYFEHTKYSSFVRQANGWGFRRITQGKDQGSYYHPKFLRNLAHLCKTMKRLVKSSKKRPADPSTEPDLFKVSELHPLPEHAEDDTIMLSCTVQGGPKARMPVFSGAQALQAVTVTGTDALSLSVPQIAPTQVSTPTSPVVSPQLQSQVQGVPPAPIVSFRPSAPPTPVEQPHQGVVTEKTGQAPSSPVVASPFPLSFMMLPQMASYPPSGSVMMAVPTTAPSSAAPAPAPGPEGAASFAAGFAAATAFSQQHFSQLIQTMAAGNHGRAAN